LHDLGPQCARPIALIDGQDDAAEPVGDVQDALAGCAGREQPQWTVDAECVDIRQDCGKAVDLDVVHRRFDDTGPTRYKSFCSTL
jgi:hypothetical protein